MFSDPNLNLHFSLLLLGKGGAKSAKGSFRNWGGVFKPMSIQVSVSETVVVDALKEVSTHKATEGKSSLENPGSLTAGNLKITPK